MEAVTLYYRCTSYCGESVYETVFTDRDWTEEYWKGRALELAADDYWSEHDGWECDWPLDFEVFKDEGCSELISKGEVYMEAKPEFSAVLSKEVQS